MIYVGNYVATKQTPSGVVVAGSSHVVVSASSAEAEAEVRKKGEEVFPPALGWCGVSHVQPLTTDQRVALRAALERAAN